MKKQTKVFDFCGWATRNDVKCADGLIIKKDSFKHNDGQKVPLVWMHEHSDVDYVLGHAILENREEGVYAYCSFNNTPQGQHAKETVQHGDVDSLSIYANQLKRNGNEVIHGNIREVSLVLAGANPGAKIETVLAHSADKTEEDDIYQIYNNCETFEYDVTKEFIEHSDEDPKDDPKDDPKENDKTVQEIFDSMTEEQKTVLYAMVGAALEDAKNQEENDNMKHNAFENDVITQNYITHADMEACFAAAKRSGSLRDAISDMLKNNEQCIQHGITNIDVLFPEFKAVEGPKSVDDDDEWVEKVMSKVHHSPFSRIKSSYFDLTGEEARARGYVKGTKKVEEVIAAFKRTTTPQMVYKTQKLDREDVIDITEFDVVAYIKQEMRNKLNREIARAILIGDGRDVSSQYKISELNIRPILGDNSVYTTSIVMKKNSVESQEATDNEGSSNKFTRRFIKKAVKSRKQYKGKGNPTLYCTEDLLNDMLLLEDEDGRDLYDNIDKLKTKLRVSDIVTVPEFEQQTREVNGKTLKLMGIIVNLADYNVGADKGGEVNMFDDFDIDYNKLEYLIETRCSGALVTPYSALTFEEDVTVESESETVEGE